MKIKPELPSGVRDFLPQEMVRRQWMLDTIRRVFENFGYVPLETPHLEKEGILTGGDPNFGMTIFRATSRPQMEPEGIALRFDLTVPLARVVAAYPQELPMPFKRHQLGKVFRGEKPQSGRFREFLQFDADAVGTRSMAADAEIVAVMCTVMTELGISNFLIRVNNRKILNGLAECVGFPTARTDDVLRAIDKLDRDGWEPVKAELMRQPDNIYDESAIALTSEQTGLVEDFLGLHRSAGGAILEELAGFMGNSSIAMAGVQELREIGAHLTALGVPDEKWRIDLSVARGLGYYTGPVFETMLTDLPKIGSVFSGGRYDDLVARFGQSLPATGASVGVDRLFVAMEQLGLLPGQRSTTQVLVLDFDKSCTLWAESIASQLRWAGIRTEFYIGQEEDLRGQLTYGVKREVPVIVIAGSAERDKSVVKLRRTATREQIEISLSELVDKVAWLLQAGVSV